MDFAPDTMKKSMCSKLDHSLLDKWNSPTDSDSTTNLKIHIRLTDYHKRIEWVRFYRNCGAASVGSIIR